MKPSEIKAESTYLGRRHPLYGRYPVRVVEAMGPFCDCVPECKRVHYLDKRTGARGLITLKSFARWAVREVPAGREGGEGKA